MGRVRDGEMAKWMMTSDSKPLTYDDLTEIGRVIRCNGGKGFEKQLYREVRRLESELARTEDRLRNRNRKLVELLGDVLEYQGDRLPPGWRLKLRAAIEENTDG
jgi:hypothetical protein